MKEKIIFIVCFIIFNPLLSHGGTLKTEERISGWQGFDSAGDIKVIDESERSRYGGTSNLYVGVYEHITTYCINDYMFMASSITSYTSVRKITNVDPLSNPGTMIQLYEEKNGKSVPMKCK